MLNKGDTTGKGFSSLRMGDNCYEFQKRLPTKQASALCACVDSFYELQKRHIGTKIHTCIQNVEKFIMINGKRHHRNRLQLSAHG
jgi:hypothetical protein